MERKRSGAYRVSNLSARNEMRILLACEESQEVCKAFRAMGHEAYSCDYLPCSGGKPEWHIQGDVIKHLESVGTDYYDMIIAFPSCTYLTVSNNGPMARGCSKYTIEEGKELRRQGIEFFMFFVNHPCKLKAIENPIGIMSTLYRKPTGENGQIIQPYEFGDDASKKTCLWLFGLPPLTPTNRIKGRMVNGRERFSNQTDSGQNKLTPSDTRAKERSKTYPGIAQAMATQWPGTRNNQKTLF